MISHLAPLLCAALPMPASNAPPDTFISRDTSLIAACCPAEPNYNVKEIPCGSWLEKAKRKGVDIYSYYYLELAGNPVGGRSRGFGNAANLGFAFSLDFDKIANIYGLSSYTSLAYRSGTNLSAKHIDNQFEVTELYGGETYHLVELYLKETLCDGNLRLKAGRLTAGNDFLASPFYLEYVNLAFCGNPITILFNTPFLDYPFGSWGAYLDFKPYPDLLFKFAVYNNNSNDKRNKYHGCYFPFKSTEGVMWMTEWAYLLNQRNISCGYPGNYKIGYYYITGTVPKYEGGTQKGNDGYYFLFDQMLYRQGKAKTTQGLTLFGSFLFAPKNRNEFPFFVNSGLMYKGVIPKRDKDYLAFGVAYGAYSEDLRKAQRQAKETGMTSIYGNKPQNFETILELNYWYRVNKWLAFTPDLQYVINPKGYGTTPNAFVIALQISIDLIGAPNWP